MPGAPPRQSFKELAAKGIIFGEAGRGTVVEEISEASKDVEGVMEVTHGAGIAKKRQS